VELEDKGIDERELEPDYYVDKPPTPEFIPNPAGLDKETQVEDHELFDFELEVEPLLEVVVAKALEAGRIEALEDWEKEELRKHKANYESVREAELMEVQRMESAYNRRVKETNRRIKQKEFKKIVKGKTQEKILARLISRQALSDLKQSSLQVLVDSGVLRNQKEQDFYATYLPHLFGITEEQLKERLAEKEIVSDMLVDSFFQLEKEHRNHISKEYQRRYAIKKAEHEKYEKELEQKKKRREERAKRREEKRIADLKVKIEDQMVAKAKEYEDPSVGKISDVMVADKEFHIYTIGGLLGEIILTFVKVYETYVMSNPDFKATPEVMENFLKNIADGFMKSEANIEIALLREHKLDDFILNDKTKELDEALSPDNIATHGLKYLLSKLIKFGINPELVQGLIMSVIKLKYKKPTESMPVLPEISEDKLKEVKEEEKAQEKEKIAKENEEIKRQNEMIKQKNEEIEKENKILIQVQEKIKINMKAEMPEKGRVCAILLVGTSNGPAGSHKQDEGDLNTSRKNQKAQAAVSVPKHLAIQNLLGDIRVFIINKGKKI